MRLRTTKHGLPYIALQEEGKKYILQHLQQKESKKRWSQILAEKEGEDKQIFGNTFYLMHLWKS